VINNLAATTTNFLSSACIVGYQQLSVNALLGHPVPNDINRKFPQSKAG